MVAVNGSTAVIKVTGRASFTLSVEFKRLVTELRDRGYQRFVIELSECVTMDSTFLGVLAGMALSLNNGNGPCLNLLNANQRVMDLFENLGIARLFTNIQGPEPVSGEFVPRPDASNGEANKAEVSRTCLEAHETLIACNPENLSKFKEVTQFLAEDLRRLTSKAETH